jgi:Tol biopolymer transport system component/DNA-binding winged helix-turn-helix (wHTH) protein
MSKAANRIYEFGEFRLETAERLLLRRGTPISLTPKVFDTLLVLVRNSGRLIEKDDLIEQIWPDAIVEEANLARNVWTLRKALGHGEHDCIETVPKIGYRFIATVRELSADNTGTQVHELAHAQPAPEQRMPDAAPAPPRTQSSLLRYLVPAVLVIVALTSAGLVRFWRPSAPSTGNDTGLTVLTDGSHNDIGAYWTSQSRIYFSRFVTNSRVETWTMNPDGSNQHRANTEIGSLLAGRWSPDGRKVIFTKEDDPRAYLADANGRNEIMLPFVPGNLDWSPDGSQFVYQAAGPSGTSELFVYTLRTASSVNVTNNGAGAADPSFSSDGALIAFTSWRDGNAEIYVMRADGSNVRRLTTHPAFDNYPVFSPDGTQIAFQSNRHDEHVEVYLQNLDDSTPPKRLTKSSSLTGLLPKCWSPDGTRMLVYTNRNGNSQIAEIDVDPFPRQLVLSAAADLSFPRVSSDGNRLLYEARLPDRSLELRITELDTKRTSRLFKTEPDYPTGVHLAAAWSFDDSLIAFSARANGNSEIFTINSNGSGLQNVTNNPLLDTSPAFSPDGREIVFSRDTFGQAQLYRMDVDGSGQRRVTDRAGYEMSPAFSPDGARLAFAADRDSRGLDIVLLELKRPGDETMLVAQRRQDTLPSFSPDGRRMAFIAASDGNPEIYVINTDGTGLFRVTRTREAETAPQFARDGHHIVFSSNRAGRFAVYQIDLR